MTTLYTIGYEGTDIDRFVATLKAAGVQLLADVRALPLSRKKGFSKSKLRDRIEQEGMHYFHLGALNAKSYRTSATLIRRWYLQGWPETVMAVLSPASARPWAASMSPSTVLDLLPNLSAMFMKQRDQRCGFAARLQTARPTKDAGEVAR